MKNVAVNKSFAIGFCKRAIQNAEMLLQEINKEPEFYNFHRKTIEANKKRIEEIKNEPVTFWN